MGERCYLLLAYWLGVGISYFAFSFTIAPDFLGSIPMVCLRCLGVVSPVAKRSDRRLVGEKYCSLSKVLWLGTPLTDTNSTTFSPPAFLLHHNI
jgi:hypothetical protein